MADADYSTRGSYPDERAEVARAVKAAANLPLEDPSPWARFRRWLKRETGIGPSQDEGTAGDLSRAGFPGYVAHVYAKPACVQCHATYMAMKRRGMEYVVIDISEDDEALDYVMALGYLLAPVVVVSYRSYDGELEFVRHWSGFRPELIKDPGPAAAEAAVAPSAHRQHPPQAHSA